MNARIEYSDGSTRIESFECDENDIFTMHAFEREAKRAEPNIVRVVFWS